MTINLNAAFRVQEKFFSGLSQREVIPEVLHAPGSPAGQHYYGPGVGHAVALLLTGQLTVRADRAASLSVSYRSSDGVSVRSVTSQGHQTGACQWHGDLAGATGAAVMTLLVSLFSPHFKVTHVALRQLADLTGYPVDRSSLAQLPAHNPAVKGALLHLSDCLYYELKEALEAGTISEGGCELRDTQLVNPAVIASLLGQGNLPTIATRSSGTPLAQLTRLARRGGAALLVGPPGTFKTETVKQLVLETGAAVVKLVGSPGIEDRDFIGGITPGEGGPRWVDGPLARAFSLARRGKVVLHIDEILRFLPEHLNVLIGALDTLSYRDAVAVLRPPLLAQGMNEAEVEALTLQELPDEGARYHLLSLPTGEAIFAPRANLVWGLTSNMGEGHLQVAQGLDDALLSRISVVIDFTRPDPSVALPIYEAVAGDAALARLALDFEDLTHEIVQDAEGLLARPLDPRKVIALVEEARACLEEGMGLKEAFSSAALVTAVPHCCPRDTRGVIEPAARELLLRRLQEEVLRA